MVVCPVSSAIRLAFASLSGSIQSQPLHSHTCSWYRCASRSYPGKSNWPLNTIQSSHSS